MGTKTKRKTPTTRNRRKAHEILAEMKAKRDALATRYAVRLAELDARIARIENRNAKQLALAEMQQHDALTLAEMLDVRREEMRLIRAAMKARR